MAFYSVFNLACLAVSVAATLIGAGILITWSLLDYLVQTGYCEESDIFSSKTCTCYNDDYPYYRTKYVISKFSIIDKYFYDNTQFMMRMKNTLQNKIIIVFLKAFQ